MEIDWGLLLALAGWGLPAIFGLYMLFVYKPQRPRPPGYVGRFRRPDGQIAHVGRLSSGGFCVFKDRPGWASTGEPEALSDVTGRELVTWTKLSDTPDGKDCIPRSQ